MESRTKIVAKISILTRSFFIMKSCQMRPHNGCCASLKRNSTSSLTKRVLLIYSLLRCLICSAGFTTALRVGFYHDSTHTQLECSFLCDSSWIKAGGKYSATKGGKHFPSSAPLKRVILIWTMLYI